MTTLNFDKVSTQVRPLADKNSPYHRHEATMVYKGDAADQFIQDLIEEMEQLE